MLGDEVPCEWMQAASEEARGEQIDERSNTPGLDKEIVKGDLDEQVPDMPLRQLLRPDKTWP